MFRHCVRVSSLLGVLVLPNSAHAGAWTPPENAGTAVLTATTSRATQIFDANARQQHTSSYSKFELQALFEYGIKDWLTAIASPGLQHVSIAGPTNAQRTGFGITEFGGRAKLIQGDAWILSGQATLRMPGTFDASNPAAVGYTGVETDLRVLFGVGFALGGWPSFVDVQLAQRLRAGDPPNEFRVDATFGVRPDSRWLVLLQSFEVYSEGGGSGPAALSYRYHKAQLSAVYQLTPQWAVQAGLFATVAGRNALQENGALLGVWYKF